MERYSGFSSEELKIGKLKESDMVPSWDVELRKKLEVKHNTINIAIEEISKQVKKLYRNLSDTEVYPLILEDVLGKLNFTKTFIEEWIKNPIPSEAVQEEGYG